MPGLSVYGKVREQGLERAYERFMRHHFTPVARWCAEHYADEATAALVAQRIVLDLYRVHARRSEQ